MNVIHKLCIFENRKFQHLYLIHIPTKINKKYRQKFTKKKNMLWLKRPIISFKVFLIQIRNLFPNSRIWKNIFQNFIFILLTLKIDNVMCVFLNLVVVFRMRQKLPQYIPKKYVVPDPTLFNINLISNKTLRTAYAKTKTLSQPFDILILHNYN